MFASSLLNPDVFPKILLLFFSPLFSSHIEDRKSFQIENIFNYGLVPRIGADTVPDMARASKLLIVLSKLDDSHFSLTT